MTNLLTLDEKLNNAMGNTYPKNYYALKIFGTFTYYISFIVLVIALFLVVVQNDRLNAIRVGVLGIIFLRIGMVNREPRFVLTREALIINFAFSPLSRIIPISNIGKIEEKEKIKIILKNGTPVAIDKRQFSRATRDRLISDVLVLLV